MLEAKVHLVGAGPGDPDLLTVKALRLLQRADVIVYDRLVGEDVLDLAGPRARRIFVGKTAGRESVAQEHINALLLDLARPGRLVVRLKGGDPFIFGRGGEEADYLMAHGVSVEVVPGITAALGCAASAMIPLTHRGLATSVRFVTGHCRAGWWLDLDWSSLADPKTTLVFYMASLHLDEIVLHLVAAGLDPETPAAAISSGTTGEERLLRAPLHALRTALECRPLPSPVLFVIGPVVDALTSKDRTKHPVAMPIGTLLAHVAHA